VTSQTLCKWAIPSPTLMEIWKSVPMQKAWDLFLCCALPLTLTHSLTQGPLVKWWHENLWTW
jgi:hypothetical protein